MNKLLKVKIAGLLFCTGILLDTFEVQAAAQDPRLERENKAAVAQAPENIPQEFLDDVKTVVKKLNENGHDLQVLTPQEISKLTIATLLESLGYISKEQEIVADRRAPNGFNIHDTAWIAERFFGPFTVPLSMERVVDKAKFRMGFALYTFFQTNLSASSDISKEVLGELKKFTWQAGWLRERLSSNDLYDKKEVILLYNIGAYLSHITFMNERLQLDIQKTNTTLETTKAEIEVTKQLYQQKLGEIEAQLLAVITERDNYKREIQDKSLVYENLENRLKEESLENSTNKSKLEIANQESFVFKKRYLEVRKEIENEKTNTKAKEVEFTQAIARIREELAKKTHEIAEQTLLLERTKESLTTQKGKELDLRAQLKAQVEKNEAAESKLVQQNALMASLQEKLNTLTARESRFNEKITQLNRKVEEAKVLFEEKEKAYKKKEEDYEDTLHKVCEEFVKMDTRVKETEKELGIQAAEIEAKGAQISDLNKENSKLIFKNKELNETSVNKSIVERLEKEIAKLQTQLASTIAKQLIDTQNFTTTTTQFKETNKRLTTTIQELEKENTRLRSELATPKK